MEDNIKRDVERNYVMV